MLTIGIGDKAALRFLVTAALPIPAPLDIALPVFFVTFAADFIPA